MCDGLFISSAVLLSQLPFARWSKSFCIFLRASFPRGTDFRTIWRWAQRRAHTPAHVLRIRSGHPWLLPGPINRDGKNLRRSNRSRSCTHAEPRYEINGDALVQRFKADKAVFEQQKRLTANALT